MVYLNSIYAPKPLYLSIINNEASSKDPDVSRERRKAPIQSLSGLDRSSLASNAAMSSGVSIPIVASAVTPT